MSKTCPACLWISGDDAEECERCDEPFNEKRAAAIRSKGNWKVAQTILSLFIAIALTVLIAQHFDIQPASLLAMLKTGAQSFYLWMLGPNQVFKPYLIGMIVAPLLAWVFLWIASRMR